MADAKRVIEAIEELRPFPPDTPIVRQINAAKAVAFEGFDECFWNPKTNEALSIDDVDVDPAFVRAVLIFIPDEEFRKDTARQQATCSNADRRGFCECCHAADSQRAEVKRLTEALHKLCVHPDYEYATTKTARKSGMSIKPEGDGWEPNVYGDDPHSAWERFDFHEEEYWRRLKLAVPTPRDAS